VKHLKYFVVGLLVIFLALLAIVAVFYAVYFGGWAAVLVIFGLPFCLLAYLIGCQLLDASK
jgi:hypothetical protein